MKQLAIIGVLLALISAACMTAVPVSPISPVSPTVENVTATETKQPIRTTAKDYSIETCKFVAVTETNIREYASINSDVVGIVQVGETVQAACGLGEWARVRDGWICVPALTGTGGCKR